MLLFLPQAKKDAENNISRLTQEVNEQQALNKTLKTERDEAQATIQTTKEACDNKLAGSLS